MEKISVITETIPSTAKKFLKKILFSVKKNRVGGHTPKKYSGHQCVTRSLVEGLEKIKADYNYNPKKITELKENVIVLSGVKQLAQMIEFKKRGLIKRLLAGPNIMVLPSMYDKILADKNIDYCIVPSNWVKELYELDCPELIGRIKAWPAGINEKDWVPSPQKKNPKNILFYHKRPEKKMFAACKECCEKAGYNVEVIFYGHYSLEEYKKALQRNSILVHFVEQESQGISLLESWSSDVPTIVWNPIFFYIGGRNVTANSSPYLTESTGAYFKDLAEFKNLEKNGFFDSQKYSPRKWVLENLTDEKSAQRLLDIINAA
jgi:Glycosyl transferases group 1.